MATWAINCGCVVYKMGCGTHRQIRYYLEGRQSTGTLPCMMHYANYGTDVKFCPRTFLPWVASLHGRKEKQHVVLGKISGWSSSLDGG